MVLDVESRGRVEQVRVCGLATEIYVMVYKWACYRNFSGCMIAGLHRKSSLLQNVDPPPLAPPVAGFLF